MRGPASFAVGPLSIRKDVYGNDLLLLRCRCRASGCGCFPHHMKKNLLWFCLSLLLLNSLSSRASDCSFHYHVEKAAGCPGTAYWAIIASTDGGAWGTI